MLLWLAANVARQSLLATFPRNLSPFLMHNCLQYLCASSIFFKSYPVFCFYCGVHVRWLWWPLSNLPGLLLKPRLGGKKWLGLIVLLQGPMTPKLHFPHRQHEVRILIESILPSSFCRCRGRDTFWQSHIKTYHLSFGPKSSNLLRSSTEQNPQTSVAYLFGFAHIGANLSWAFGSVVVYVSSVWSLSVFSITMEFYCADQSLTPSCHQFLLQLVYSHFRVYEHLSPQKPGDRHRSFFFLPPLGKVASVPLTLKLCTVFPAVSLETFSVVSTSTIHFHVCTRQ